MATIIRVAGADFSANPVGFMPPVVNGLEAWFYLGGDLTKSGRNLAPGKAAGSFVGAPTIAESYLRLNTSNYLSTSVLDAAPGEVTLLAVAKMPTGFAYGGQTFPIVTAHQPGALAPYMSFQAASGSVPEPAGRVVAAANYNNSGAALLQQAVSANIADITAFRFYSGAQRNAVGPRITDKTSGLSSQGSTALSRYTYPSQNYRIGMAPASQASVDVAFAAIYNRVLSTDEETAVYTAVKAYMSRKFSITI